MILPLHYFRTAITSFSRSSANWARTIHFLAIVAAIFRNRGRHAAVPKLNDSNRFDACLTHSLLLGIRPTQSHRKTSGAQQHRSTKLKIGLGGESTTLVSH